MGRVCALLLSGSDIRFLGTTGPEPEPDIRYIPNHLWPDHCWMNLWRPQTPVINRLNTCSPFTNFSWLYYVTDIFLAVPLIMTIRLLESEDGSNVLISRTNHLIGEWRTTSEITETKALYLTIHTTRRITRRITLFAYTTTDYTLSYCKSVIYLPHPLSIPVAPRITALFIGILISSASFFTPLRYVPNVAKRSTWHHCIYWGPTDRQPTSRPGKFRTAISRQRFIRSNSYLVLG